MGRAVTEWILMIPPNMVMSADTKRRLLIHMAWEYPSYTFKVDRVPWSWDRISVAPMLGVVGDGFKDSGGVCDMPPRSLIDSVAAHAHAFNSATSGQPN